MKTAVLNDNSLLPQNFAVLLNYLYSQFSLLQGIAIIKKGEIVGKFVLDFDDDTRLPRLIIL